MWCYLVVVTSLTCTLEPIPLCSRIWIFNVIRVVSRKFTSVKSLQILHRGAIYPFSVWWIYYCYSSESSGEKTDKAHLCVLPCSPDPVQTTPKLEILKKLLNLHQITRKKDVQKSYFSKLVFLLHQLWIVNYYVKSFVK